MAGQNMTICNVGEKNWKKRRLRLRYILVMFFQNRAATFLG
jgi:hypothetical protein